MNSPISVLAFFGLPGWQELLIIAFVGLLLFGKRLPEVARSLGKSVIEFKKGMRDVKDELTAPAPPDAPRQIENRATSALPRPAEPAQSTPAPAEPRPVETGE